MTNAQNLDLLAYLTDPKFAALLRQHLGERRAVFVEKLIDGGDDEDDILRGCIREIDEMLRLSVVLERIVKKKIDDREQQ